jgi:hypothetical protein
LSHLYIKPNILPRQARDKHRENTQKGDRFSSGNFFGDCMWTIEPAVCLWLPKILQRARGKRPKKIPAAAAATK